MTACQVASCCDDVVVVLSEGELGWTDGVAKRMGPPLVLAPL